MASAELDEILRKRLEKVERGQKHESTPQESSADCVHEDEKPAGKDTGDAAPSKDKRDSAGKIDFASAIAKRRGLSDQGSSWESKPAETSADVQHANKGSQKKQEQIVREQESAPSDSGEALLDVVADDADEAEDATAEIVAEAVAEAIESAPAPDSSVAAPVAPEATEAESAPAPAVSAAASVAPEATEAPGIPIDLVGVSDWQAKATKSKSKAKAKGKSKVAEPAVPEVEAERAASSSEDGSDSDGAEALDTTRTATSTGKGEHKANRAEKKSRKAVSKLGMKPVSGIVRVTIKKGSNVLFIVAEPEVHKAPGSDTYIVFGECKIEDLSAQAQASAAQQLAAAGASGAASLGAMGASDGSAEESQIQEVEDDDDGEVDDAGVSAADIDLVISQAGCSRSKAVKALKANNNDIVEAIMALSSG